MSTHFDEYARQDDTEHPIRDVHPAGWTCPWYTASVDVNTVVLVHSATAYLLQTSFLSMMRYVYCLLCCWCSMTGCAALVYASLTLHIQHCKPTAAQNTQSPQAMSMQMLDVGCTSRQLTECITVRTKVNTTRPLLCVFVFALGPLLSVPA